MDTFGDPGWFHHQQIAQLWGLTALRLATSQIVEFNATAYTNKLKSYLDSLETIMLDNAGEEFDNVKKDVNLKRLEKAINGLSKYAQHLDAKADDLIRNQTHRKCYFNLFCMNRSRAAETERVNNAYLEFERGFIGKGLPGRPIYKHVIYAPGTWEGYAGFTFPSIREALAERRWKEAKGQVKEISKLLTKAAAKENTLEHSRCT
jgi:N-acetylated-alpha-linked acidic dipeptidase